MRVVLNQSEWWDQSGVLTDRACEHLKQEVARRLNHRCPNCRALNTLVPFYKLARLQNLFETKEDPPMIAMACERCGGYFVFNVDSFFRKGD